MSDNLAEIVFSLLALFAATAVVVGGSVLIAALFFGVF
jgi:hypothetical protein